LKVAQISFSLSNRAGGIFEIQLGLSLALHNLGVDVCALGLQDDLTERDIARWQGIPTKCLSVFGPRFFGFAREFGQSIVDFQPDICHLQTLWMYPSIALLNWHKKTRRPYVVTPNGMLEPWALANSGWKKQMAGFFYENAMLRGAACLQANTLKEADDFRAYGLKNRIEIIPNGVDLPEMGNAESRNAGKVKEGKKRLLFLGRIHPKKGLVGALQAWAELRNSPSAIRDSAEWQFVIAGWDQGGHEAELRALCGELGLKIASVFSHGGTRSTEGQNLKLNSYKLKTSPPELESADVLFFGPAFGGEKDALLRSADAFVLPSFSEGLPMSVLEAWSYGLPVVMTPECNLPEGFASGAALEIRNSAGGFEGMRTLIEMTDQERAAMGMRGRRLVEEKLTWPKVAAQMKGVYESLL
jgi:poly(glycerol-phosphate) alpha-glucosyltransferase